MIPAVEPKVSAVEQHLLIRINIPSFQLMLIILFTLHINTILVPTWYNVSLVFWSLTLFLEVGTRPRDPLFRDRDSFIRDPNLSVCPGLRRFLLLLPNVQCKTVKQQAVV